MAEQEELDRPVAARPAPVERRTSERRTPEERLRILEQMVISPEWVKCVEDRLTDLERRITKLADDHLNAGALTASRLAAVERVAGLTPHMQNQMGMLDRTSQVRESHEKQVMDEALSRRKEAEDRVKSRVAAQQQQPQRVAGGG